MLRLRGAVEPPLPLLRDGDAWALLFTVLAQLSWTQSQ